MSVTFKPRLGALGLVGLGVALLLGGCSRVEDRRSGSGVCEVHNATMQTAVVYPCNKMIHWTTDYLRDRPRLFPHCVDYAPSEYDYEGQRFKVYVCPACARAREEYIAKRKTR